MCCCCSSVKTRKQQDFPTGPETIRAIVFLPQENDTLKEITSIALESFKGATVCYYTDREKEPKGDFNVFIQIEGRKIVLLPMHRNSQAFYIRHSSQCTLGDVTEVAFHLAMAFPKAERQESKTKFDARLSEDEDSFYSPKASTIPLAPDLQEKPKNASSTCSPCSPKEPKLKPAAPAFEEESEDEDSFYSPTAPTVPSSALTS